MSVAEPGSILIVDDHELVRMGLRAMMDSLGLGRLHILEAATLQEGIDAYRNAEDGVKLVVLDLNLPDSKGLSALQAFKQAYPQSKVVVLSGSVDEVIAEEARVLGAVHFLHKTGDPSHVGNVLMGLRSDIPESAPQAGSSQASKRLRLSSREVEILDLLLQGSSNQEIVDATGLKMGTVKNYISGLLVVFGVASRSKLISLFR